MSKANRLQEVNRLRVLRLLRKIENRGMHHAGWPCARLFDAVHSIEKVRKKVPLSDLTDAWHLIGWKGGASRHGGRLYPHHSPQGPVSAAPTAECFFDFKEEALPIHARPHLSTHSRGQGHSAVAGAAYRLGLKLLDQRTSELHDYTYRRDHGEIVRALTVGPRGAPEWIFDPAVLWNTVEQMERRSDAQVARDFRIPVPFGLTDQQAAELAEDVAQYLAVTLQTPVSLGLHRDAERDVLGDLKPRQKIGYHAHLYFPTRQIACWNGEGRSPTPLTFGAKITELRYRKTSGPLVELFNRRWAELSNVHLGRADLPPDRDHRSYARLGITKAREPKMGQRATALERQGHFTRKGALVKTIRAQAQAVEVAQRRTLDLQRTPSREPAASALTPSVPDEVDEARKRGATLADQAALVDRVIAALPAPTSATRPVYVKLMAVLRRVQRTLGAIPEAAARRTMMEEDHRRASTGLWYAGFWARDAREEHAHAMARVARWEAAHGGRLRWQRLTGAERPMALQALDAQVERDARWVAEAARHRSQMMERMEAWGRLEDRAVRLDESLQSRLRAALMLIPSLDSAAIPALMASVTDDQRPWLERAMPARTVPESVPEPALAPPPASHQERPRLRPRP